MSESVAMAELFGRTVQVVRDTRGFSSRELAQHMGVSSGTIGRLEAGRLMPTLQHVTRLCEVLNARTLELWVLRPDRWRPALFVDLVEHVVRSIAPHFETVWDPAVDRPGDRLFTGVQVAGLVRGPVIEWLAGAQEAGWPDRLIVPQEPDFQINEVT